VSLSKKQGNKMKKTALSLVALLALSTIANATPASDLEELKGQMEVMAEKVAAMEAKAAEKKKVKEVKNATQITSKSPTIEMSGTHYLGFVSADDNINDVRTNKFETRRNYIQAKAFFKENPKDYLRITLDTFQNVDKNLVTPEDNGSWEVRLKYAYLYLDEILPYTGVELGQVHRPWIDYEEHNSWMYRSISKVFVEDKGHGVDFTNSADLGVNFKTKTPYFSSELALLNGAGYHAVEDSLGLSKEWRLTGHILGTGKEKAKPELQYANVSFFGQMNSDDSKGRGDATNKDFNWYGLHAVYNQPEFLVAAQYIKTADAKVSLEGKGYSINAEARLTPEIGLIGLYNNYDYDSTVATDIKEKKGWLAGAVYHYNKNVDFLANYLSEDAILVNGTKNTDLDSIMLTAEVKW
jgi:hypothetical protein